MGWSILLTANRDIREEDVECALDQMADGFKKSSITGVFLKNDWGWSAYADVYKPEGRVLRLGGSYGESGRLAVQFAAVLRAYLYLLGYERIVVDTDGYDNP